MELLPCPCGQTPPDFCLEGVGMKYGHASPNCCNDWGFEFRIQYEQDVDKVMAMAARAWNALPRRSPLSQETVDKLRAVTRADDEDILDEPRTPDYLRAMNVLRDILTEIEGKQS